MAFVGGGGGGGGGGSGGGSGGTGRTGTQPGSQGVVIYSVSWDCGEDYTRAVISRGGDYDVQLFSGQGRVGAEEAAVQGLPGRVIYEAAYIPDFFSLRVFALDGRSLQTDSKTVRVGDSCTGERVYVTYGGAAAAAAPAGAAPPASEAERDALPREAQPSPPTPPPRPAAERDGQPAVQPPRPPPVPEAGADPASPFEVPPVGTDPASYVARYASDGAYRQWYDENHAASIGSICAAVGLPEGCVERHLASLGGARGQDSGGAADRPADAPPAAGMPGGPSSGEGGGDPGAEGGGCLVATAAYGSELAPQVQALREARDAALYGAPHGAALLSAFNSAYYAASPAVADMERGHPWLRDAVRAAIAPAVAAASALASTS